MTSAEKIIIADDHPLFRQALAIMLQSHFSEAELLEAQSIPDLEQLLLMTPVDLLLLDLDIPGAQGFNTLINIRAKYPQMGVVIISGIEDADTINKAMQHGAAGFIPKSTAVSDMVLAIGEVFNGNLWIPAENVEQGAALAIDQRLDSLTPQQHKILLMFADGLLNKQIAFDLGLAESTKKSHASTIFLKLGVKNRTQAVILLNEIVQGQTCFGPSAAN
ncbi:MAG: DNA-binding response regulator, LuxR family protein [Osedax symbiont Rs2]|nr:MAG: DNA-binding response regulator, LuxR family protein [Osedax symbiont Rs2]